MYVTACDKTAKKTYVTARRCGRDCVFCGKTLKS